MKKGWIFRVSSSLEVGAGHVMRCLSLARVIKDSGVEVKFLLCSGGEHWIKTLRKLNIESEIVNLDEIYDCYNVVIDGYEFTDEYISSFKCKDNHVVFISDNGLVPPSVDTVLSSHKDVVNNIMSNQVVLGGYKYALLSPEYSNNDFVYKSNDVKKILITFGYMDNKNFSSMALLALNGIGFSGAVTIALGRQSLNIENIKKVVQSCSFTVNIVYGSHGLLSLFKETDLVIGSGGVSLLERAAVGVPSVTIVVAENQLEQVKLAEKEGITHAVNIVKKNTIGQLENGINFLIKNKNYRLSMSRKCLRLIDGKGTFRVVESILTRVSRINSQQLKKEREVCFHTKVIK